MRTGPRECRRGAATRPPPDPGRRLGGGNPAIVARAAQEATDGDQLVDGGEADEAVHDPADGVGLAEVEADERRDEVELRERDQPPVQATDDHQCAGEDVELLHWFPPVDGLYKDRRDISDYVKKLCSVCTVSTMEAAAGHVRIGELSRRTGVSPELLRAWEHRYGLLRPMRSERGFRLYSPQDERRVALMRSHLERGLSAAEAARLALDEEAVGSIAETPALERGARNLRSALDTFDEGSAQAALDRLLSDFSIETVGCSGSRAAGTA